MRKYIPILIILLLMAAVFLFDLHKHLTFENLRENREALKSLVARHPWGAPLLFIALYMVSTALSIPGAIFLTLFGGFLFPQPYSTIYVVTGATLGAVIIFLAAKTALGDFLRQQAGPFLSKMRAGFQEDATSYLLFLRLVPLFPFWLVNIAPAFFGVPLSTFAWTTFVGIIPGAFVYTQAGVGLGAILDAGETLTLSTIFNVQVRIALIALGIFALIPVVIKKIRKRNSPGK